MQARKITVQKKTKVVKRAGLTPGALVFVGDKKVAKVRIRVFDWTEEAFEEKELDSIEESFPYRDRDSVSWINVDGLHDTELFHKLGKHFAIHPLVLEDILNTGQRPKNEDFGEYIFFVLKMLLHHEKDEVITNEQISIVLGPNFVISFQETVGDVFTILRNTIRNQESRIRKRGADYFCYRMIDTIVDNYFVILEKFGDRIEVVESELMDSPSKDQLREIYALKTELLAVRKSIWPLREAISALQREETKLIQDSTIPFLRDVYDHTIQVIDTVESLRDTVTGMMDLYLSSVSNRMNEVMKTLTIMASIFIPLTFIAGIYGMNFNPDVSPLNMPELNSALGYPFAILSMVLVALIMILYFKRKDWL
jgi:magnesium transporter